MKKIKLVLYIICILGTSQLSQAQYLCNLSDQQSLELSIDLLRKSIQTENMLRIKEVFGAEVLVNNAKISSELIVSKTLPGIFLNSSKRKQLSSQDVRFLTNKNNTQSNLWDFDIVSPTIKIVGDTAFVECELVFWNAFSSESSQRGSKISEKLIFILPQKNESNVSKIDNPLRWKLVGCNSFFDFVGSYGNKKFNHEIQNREE